MVAERYAGTISCIFLAQLHIRLHVHRLHEEARVYGELPIMRQPAYVGCMALQGPAHRPPGTQSSSRCCTHARCPWRNMDLENPGKPRAPRTL